MRRIQLFAFITILTIPLALATRPTAKPPKVVIFDVHGVLLKENIDVYTKGLVYDELLKLQRPPNRSFKRSAPFKCYCALLDHYKPLSDLNLPPAPASGHLNHETYHLFAGSIAPNLMYRRVKTMLTQAVEDGYFKDKPDHMPLMVNTLIDVIFDPDHIHREHFMHPLYEGLRLMQTIVARGITTAILSNVPHDWMMQYLHSAKLRPQFAFLRTENILTSGKLHALKPSVEAFDKICTQFHCKREDILLIDDTPANISGAHDHGVRAIYFNHLDMDRVLKELKREGALSANNARDLSRELSSVHTAMMFGQRTLF